MFITMIMKINNWSIALPICVFYMDILMLDCFAFQAQANQMTSSMDVKSTETI